MSVQTVRFRTSPEQVPVATERINALFDAVHAAAPRDMRYIALRETGEPVFTLILELPDGTENPLPSIPAAVAFRRWLSGRTEDDPAPCSCTVVCRYSA
ncbi:hypothetical protein [Streptomyces sp. OUCMDZ-3434]|uniref:hypothetical protein n=1 Tax=Streptomyces sp. OUCMDZ-3434 TaxID=1535304 RepID=UPI001E44BE19|nr:hypothetical protein [Streptomyces sp. OUCMDZ-3434]